MQEFSTVLKKHNIDLYIKFILSQRKCIAPVSLYSFKAKDKYEITTSLQSPNQKMGPIWMREKAIEIQKQISYSVDFLQRK